ncbi:MAG: discoidin domain-containing protein, partial [Bacteroidaceae bacterium]|nr:discoidin domain-containing protein [Bacteroidaceae bacterium]
DGTLTDAKNLAGIFKFRKTSGGAVYGFGYRIDSGGTRFTNPKSTHNSDLTLGSINTTTADRVDWDTQVLFLNSSGKYAVRATNSAGGGSEGSWSYVAGTYWTVNAGPLAEYSFTASFVWELEKKYDVSEVLLYEEAQSTMQTWIPGIQASAGLVRDASYYTSNAKDPVEGSYANLLDGDYTTFFHSTWHSSNDPQADHYLQAELAEPTQKFQFYYKKRSQNNDNRPTTIVISASNDGTSFTDVQTISSGLPTSETVIDYLSDVIDLGAAYKYVRFTVTATNNGAKTGNHVFFTFSEFYMMPNTPEVADALAMIKAGTPTYMVDLDEFTNVQSALMAASNSVTVTYKLVEADGTVVSTKVVVQEANSEVTVPVEFINEIFYDYEVTGTVGSTDCEIIVKRTFKEGLVVSLDDLSNAKAYTITCDRGKFLTKDGYLASTAHNSLTNAEPSTFAIISYEGNYYLYSVADGKFVTNNGALADEPTSGTADAIIMDAKTVPYFLYRFNKSNAYLNTNGNNPYGYVINSYSTPDAGNQYYMFAVADFDATNALAALQGYFHVMCNVTYVVKDANGNTLFTSDPIPTEQDEHITALPEAFQRPFCTYSDIDVTVTENTTIECTVTWTPPITVADSYENIVWQNIYIDRTSVNNSKWYLMASSSSTTPVFKANPTSTELASKNFQWGFVGDAYQGIKIYQKGWTFTLAYQDVPFLSLGTVYEYVWDDLVKNGDGILIGRNGRYLNQSGGASATKLGLWEDKTDQGSTWFASEVPVFTYVYFNVIYNGRIVKTAITSAILGSDIPAIPAELNNGLVTLSAPPTGTITQPFQHIMITATANTPFEFTTASDLSDAKWYNMTIRGDWYVFTEETEPYFPKQNPTNTERNTDAYQWAFGGNPYSVEVYNKAFGAGYTLTRQDSSTRAEGIAVMRQGTYAWDAHANGNGFVLKEAGAPYNCINQNGGGGGPFTFWNDHDALTDEGSTLRVVEVPDPEPYPLTIGETGYATLYLPFATKPKEASALPEAAGRWTFDNPDNLLAGTGVATLEFVTQDQSTVTVADQATADITAVEGPAEGNGAIYVPASSGLMMTANTGATSFGTYTILMDIKCGANTFDDHEIYQSHVQHDHRPCLTIGWEKIRVSGSAMGFVGSIVSDTWYRIVLVVEEANRSFTLYVNGEKLGTEANVVESLYDQVLKMSSTSSLFFVEFAGEKKDITTSEIRFWDIALTDEQVAELGTAETIDAEPKTIAAFTGKVTEYEEQQYLRLRALPSEVIPAYTP